MTGNTEPSGNPTGPTPPPLAEPSAWHDLELTVNGEVVRTPVESRLLLSDLLRHRLGLTGTHVGCEQGSCGACTVLIDGAAARSCTTFAVQCHGREITTVEALAAGGELNPAQQAFHDEHAMQCGFCTSGFVVSLTELAEREAAVTEDEMLDQLGGHFCRCTGYLGIRRAARSVLGLKHPESAEGHTAEGRTGSGECSGGTDDVVDQGVSQLRSEGGPWIGRRLPRREDDRLLRGHGRYVDDLDVPGTLEVAFVRSAQAHARLHRVDVTAARSYPGVVAVYTAFDLADRLEPLINTEELRVPPGLRQALDPVVKIQPMAPLATDEVNYVGQPIVMIVAETRYLAEDAAAAVEIGYESLPAVIDPIAAMAPDAPRVLLTAEDNIGLRVRAHTGDAAAAIAQAPVVITETFASQRYLPAPIETRGILAQVGPYRRELQVWSNTQTPHRVRDHIAEALGLSPDDVTVTPVDVGGGFGQKGILIVEELLIPFAARDLERPVRWIADRNENLVADTHAREQRHEITVAADTEGRLLAVTDTIVVNLGCRNLVGLVVPYNSVAHLTGGYRVPNLDIEAIGVLTNTTYTTPYRGAGRPEAVFAMERAMDRLASRLGLEPAEIRRRNLLRPDDFPYRSGLLDRRGLPQELDTGDYPEMLRRATASINLPLLRERQIMLREQGRYLGIGFAFYTEMSGLGPFESAHVGVQNSGRIRVSTGAPSQGQGHATSFAQIAADALGVDVEDIDVVGGDTVRLPYGIGTIASRALVTAGNAVHRAATAVRAKIIGNAAAVLGVPADEVQFTGGELKAGDRILTLRELVLLRALTPGGGEGNSLSELSYFRPPNYATSSGLHAAVLEVDPVTGKVTFVDYVVVHEAGRVVNPLIADGQILGGTAQGLGGALYEHMRYDAAGQPITSTFMDYLLPTIESVPDIRLDEIVCPTPTNELGVKGLGEGGAVGPPAAVANAVEDALTPFGVVVRGCPLTPDAIRTLLRDAARTPAPATN
ncbi:molybdopterin-dependent oxidoreductase [Nocardia aurantia]|uniref:2Fe-2S ferredoxin-type domain-containing protein n=1 Tax=Nocardia aurantia TaxID=2585199 RepID=A0A7K0DT49_9NOCA|nr:molybdopterin-dependent oxidoreductase [Nocardia aurantia]MQY28707.1 hypothetical protein [Nocardia aurantia]